MGNCMHCLLVLGVVVRSEYILYDSQDCTTVPQLWRKVMGGGLGIYKQAFLVRARIRSTDSSIRPYCRGEDRSLPPQIKRTSWMYLNLPTYLYLVLSNITKVITDGASGP